MLLLDQCTSAADQDNGDACHVCLVQTHIDAVSAPVCLKVRGETCAGLVRCCARLPRDIGPATPQTKAAEPCLGWPPGSASGKVQLQPSGLGGQPAEGFGVRVRGYQQPWVWKHGAPVGCDLMSKRTMKLSQHSPSACTQKVGQDMGYAHRQPHWYTVAECTPAQVLAAFHQEPQMTNSYNLALQH